MQLDAEPRKIKPPIVYALRRKTKAWRADHARASQSRIRNSGKPCIENSLAGLRPVSERFKPKRTAEDLD